MHMITRLTVAYLLFFPVTIAMGKSARILDPAAVYAAMASTDVRQLDAMLAALEKTNLPAKTAYEGGLLMKKAGLLSKAKDKLKVFKEGREKLETAIRNDSEKVEYRFLRLMIQENAPKILGYKKNLEEDRKMVISSYKTLPAFLQQVIKDYSKSSKNLKPTDL